MRGLRVDTTVELQTELCFSCGMLFAITADFQNRRRLDKSIFYCPAGHGQIYQGDTETDKLRREVQRLTQQEARHLEEAQKLRDVWNMAEVKAAKAEAARKRIEKRVANGVCPDCNRSFTDLRRHIASKHGPKCEVVKLSAAS